MRFRVVQRILGLLLMLYSITMLPPTAVSAYFGDGQAPAFVGAFAIILIVGFIAWIPARRDQRELRLRDGFLIAAVFWLGLGTFSAAPLLLTAMPDMSVTDAVFEAVSGLTTTGSTVLTGLDSLPKSILYYRAQLQAGRHGHHRTGRRNFADARCRWHAVISRETPGPMKDKADAPDHRDSQGPVAGLC